jgi:hypothetical protein
MKIIVNSKTYGEKEIFFDKEDWNKVKDYTWGVHFDRFNFYAVTHLKQDKYPTASMHEIIIGKTKNKEIDHKNGNGLDNRKCNLRTCTHAENLKNLKNLKKRKNTSSKFKGVMKHGTYWQSEIRIGKKEYI